MSVYDEKIQRFLDSDIRGTELDKSVKPLQMSGESVSNLQLNMSDSQSAAKKDDGLGERTAMIVHSEVIHPHLVQDPKILDVAGPLAKDSTLVTIWLHYGVALGSTSVGITEPKNKTQLCRFYTIGEDPPAQADDSSGFTAKVKLYGVNYGMLEQVVNENISFSEGKKTPKRGPEGRGDIGPAPKSGGGKHKYKNGKKQKISGKPPAAVEGINSDKSWEGPGPPFDEETKKALLILRKLDQSNQYPIINNKFGLLYPSAGSKQAQHMYSGKGDIPKLVDRRDNIEQHFQLISLPLKNFKGEQFFKFRVKIGNYTGDLIENRGNQINENAPQAVTGTEHTLVGIRNIEKIWCDLRIEALQAGYPDPGAFSETILNGYRSRQINFWRSMNRNQRKQLKQTGKFKHNSMNLYFDEKNLNKYDHSHTLGTAIDVQQSTRFLAGPGRSKSKLHQQNWKRMVAILSRLVWAGGFTQDDNRTGLMGFGFGWRHYHLGMRRTDLIMGNKYTHWNYNSPIIPPEWRNTKGGRKKVTYPFFSSVVKYGVAKFTNEMNHTYPNWTKVLKKHGCYPKEFGGS